MLVVVALVLAAGGCASEPEHTTTVAPANTATVQAAGTGAGENANGTGHTDATPPGGADTGVTVTITISGDTISPPPGRVEVRSGQTVHLKVTSDRQDEVHIHGYDIEVPVSPAKPATISFVADRSGLFEVETHHPAARLTQLLVR